MSAFVYGTAIATSTYLWANVFNWNTCAFYATPYGWRPPAAYYRPYGARNLGIYDHNNVTRLSGNNVVRGGVTINNNNVNVNRSSGFQHSGGFEHSGGFGAGLGRSSGSDNRGTRKSTIISGPIIIISALRVHILCPFHRAK